MKKAERDVDETVRLWVSDDGYEVPMYVCIRMYYKCACEKKMRDASNKGQTMWKSPLKERHSTRDYVIF